jgi:uncharacterized protein DUF1707
MSTEDQSAPRGPRTNRMRASDSERETVAEAIRAAVADGRLNLEEGDERLATLYATKYRDELGPLTADLPKGDDDQPGWGSAAPGSWTGPGQWGGPGPWGRGGPWGPGHGGPWGYARPPRPWRLVPLLVILALIGTIGAAVHGHFFWPIIPLILVFSALRFGACRAWRRMGRSAK